MTNIEKEIKWFKQRFKNIDEIYRGDKNGMITTAVKLKPFAHPFRFDSVHAIGVVRTSISNDNVELGILWAYQKAIEDAVKKSSNRSAQ